MDGAEALAFVRERKQLSEGDISRGRRQQAFIKALMLKSLSKDMLANPVKLAQFIDAGTSNLTVDDGFTRRRDAQRGISPCAACAARTSPSSRHRSAASAPHPAARPSTCVDEAGMADAGPRPCRTTR